MKNSIKQLGKDSIIYGFGDVLKRSIGFLLLPLYTRFLTPADYGQLELLMVTLTILFIISTQGLSTAFFRFYAYASDEIHKLELISTCFYYLLISAVITCAILSVFSAQFTQLIFESSSNFGLYLKIVSVTAVLQIASLIPFQLYRVMLQSTKFVAVSIFGFIVEVVLNIYLVAGLKLSVEGVLIGNMVGSFIVFSINIILIKNLLSRNFSLVRLGELLRFGFPLIFAAIFTWILQISDRILLQQLASIEEVGLYSLGSRFASILTITIIGPFSTAWGAYCFQIATKENAGKTYARIASYWLLILTFFGLVLILFSPLVIELMAAEVFWNAQNVVLPLVYMGIVFGMYSLVDLGINIAKKTKYMAYIVCVGAALNVLLNILLIPKFGMRGSAYASLVSFTLMLLITYQISQKLYFIPFEKRRLLKIGTLFCVISLAAQFVEIDNIIVNLLVKFILLGLYVVGVFVAGFLYPDEQAYLNNAYQRLRSCAKLNW